MVLEFPIRKDRFQLNNRSRGRVITIEYREACTSFNNEKALIALSSQVRFCHSKEFAYLFRWRNSINIPHKTNPFGIRTRGRMYNIVKGSGYRISANEWCENLISSVN